MKVSESAQVTNLPDYIRGIGIKAFAEKFGVSERAALAYQYGSRSPRKALAKRIVDESSVTWEGIYALPSKEPTEQTSSAA